MSRPSKESTREDVAPWLRSLAVATVTLVGTAVVAGGCQSKKQDGEPPADSTDLTGDGGDVSSLTDPAGRHRPRPPRAGAGGMTAAGGSGQGSSGQSTGGSSDGNSGGTGQSAGGVGGHGTGGVAGANASGGNGQSSGAGGSGVGGNAQGGGGASAAGAGSGNGNAAFPLKLSDNKQYLVDQNGAPFFWQGDSPWEIATNISAADVTTYFSTRKAQGFNVIILEAIEHFFTPQTHSPAWVNVNGDAPFLSALPGVTCPNPANVCLDFTKPNEAYFQNLDSVLQQAQTNGFLVLVTPAYLGALTGRDNDTFLQGWMEELKANGVSALKTYGQFLGQRYRDYPNIVWVGGGDHSPSTAGSPSEMDLVNAIAAGIIAGEGGQPTHLQTAHFDGNQGAEASDLNPAWLSLDSTYTSLGTQLYGEAQRQTKNDAGKLPVFLIESPYENSTAAVGQGTPPDQLRAQMYEPILSGEMGFDFGCDPVWYLGNAGDGNPSYGYNWAASTTGIWSSWKTALASPGAGWATIAGQFFRSIPWYSLVPDTAGAMLTSGNGVGGVILSRTMDGKLAVAYFTQTSTATIDLSSMASSVTARWFDPTNGDYSSYGTGPLSNSGTSKFTPPSSNAGGSTDWVLVLQAN